MSTSKSIERDLKTLRASKLMSTCPKYNMMIIQLEKFYNEEAKIIEKNERKDLDLRPFLYDEDDTYERPFYDILLKLLYDIVSFQSYKKQQEDVNKVYEWFLTHRRLISQDINNCDTSSSDNEVTRENISTPKLLLRPATADSSCNRESRHVTCSRDLRSSMTYYEDVKNRNRKKYSPLDSVSIALKVIPLNQHKNKLNNKTHSKLERNTSYFPTRAQRKCSLPADFILKPCKQTSSPPASSKTSNFPIPPKISPVQGKSPSQSPLVPRRTAFNIQDSTLSNKLFQCESDNPLQVKNIELSSTNFKTNTNNGEEDANTTKELEGISKTSMVDKEAKLLENQIKHLQNRKRNKELELMEHFKSDTENLLLDEISLQSLLLRDYEQFIKDERERNAKEFESLSSAPSTLPKVELYDVGKQRPVSAVELRNIQDNNVCLESIIDLVHPVSEQMKYAREMKSNGMSIWDMESTMSDTINSCQRNHSAASRSSFFDGLDRKFDNIHSLKFTEPDLKPEMKASDYTVHFPHQYCNHDSNLKDYKTSGPVLPDSVRYKWTDDGFGNRTYLKKRNPIEKKSHSSQRSFSPLLDCDVSMVTGERGLDEKTLASMIVIRHLGSKDRRSDNVFSTRSYPVYKLDESVHFHPSLEDSSEEGDKPQHNVEYLPFWKQILAKRAVAAQDTSKGEKLNADCRIDVKGERSEKCSTQPQIVLREMFSNLSPQKRENYNVGTSSLSVRARSISPVPRRRQCPTPNNNASRHLRPAPSPTPTHSRPTSARRSDKDNISSANFSLELMDDYKRQREIWAAINIQRIFRGHISRQYVKSLKQAKKDRLRKAAVALQSTFRGYLARKRLMKENLRNYIPSVRDLLWARQYKEKLKEKEMMRQRKNMVISRKLNREFEKHQEQISSVTASDMIRVIFNPPKPSKSQMKAAAITIQRYFRGWFVRKSLSTVKKRVLKRTFSFSKFIKSYQNLIHRIQKRYKYDSPSSTLQFHELQEYVDRLFKYEIAFGKIAENGILRYEDILRYFNECGHNPSEKEVHDAVTMVIKDTSKERGLRKAEAVEVVFHIYIPKGTGLTLADVRKSSWMNPLVNGQDVNKVLSKKDLKFTSLDKVFKVIADSRKERSLAEESTRDPHSQIVYHVNNKSENPFLQSGKKRLQQSLGKSAGGGNDTISHRLHVPSKPNEKKQSGKRRPGK